MLPTRFYVAGPMQGYPHFNFPLFHAVTKHLRVAGHSVFNPAEADIARHGGVDISLDAPNGRFDEVAHHKFSLRAALDDDTNFISRLSTGICLLPGWEFSNGALAEFFLARAIAKDPSLAAPFVFLYVQKSQIGLPVSYTIPNVATFVLEEVNHDA